VMLETYGHLLSVGKAGAAQVNEAVPRSLHGVGGWVSEG
jgi:hypothetical protein